MTMMKQPSMWLFLFLAAGLAFLPAAAGATTPVASFTSNITSGGIPLSVQFIDTSTYVPTSWTWSFGDGGTATGQDPLHTYTSAGTYTVTLTVTNADGSHTITRTGYITLSKSATAPVAAFISNATVGSEPLTIQFLDSSSNSPTAWAWSFGDGGTSTAQNPVHTYTEPGTFTVTLTAVNSAGSNTLSKDGFVTVSSTSSAPAAAFTATDTSGTSPFVVQFVDTSTNSPTSWIWSFGDGNTSTRQNPSHTYVSAGTYTVTLTATNAGGSSTETLEDYISVELTEPIASFTANVTAGQPPLAVQFTDTSANSPTAWYWSFGDGETSSLQDPVHTYEDHGRFTVVFTATNAEGSNTTSITKYINVSEIPAPEPSFTADVTTGAFPLTVRFTDTSSNAPTAWQWNFGDGSYSAIQNPVHPYATAGTYSVTLSVTNAGGTRSVTNSNYIAVTGGEAVVPVSEQTAEALAEETLPASDPAAAAPAATTAAAQESGSGSIPFIVIAVLLGVAAIAFILLRRPPGGASHPHRRDL